MAFTYRSVPVQYSILVMHIASYFVPSLRIHLQTWIGLPACKECKSWDHGSGFRVEGGVEVFSKPLPLFCLNSRRVVLVPCGNVYLHV